MKAIIDSHTHCSEFSLDADRSLSDLLLEADQKRLLAVCLTDHFDKDGVAGRLCPGISRIGDKVAEGEWAFRPQDYMSALLPLREARPIGGNQTALLIGIELGYAMYLVDDFKTLTSQNDFDQVISSIHFLDGLDIFANPCLYEIGKHKLYEHCLHTLIEMVESELDFDIVGHFDYISRYAPYRDAKLLYDDFPDEFDYLFKAMIRRDVSLEINSRARYKSIAKGLTDPGFPDRRILLRYKDLGGKMISISSDSHENGSVARFWDETAAALVDLGFSSSYYFVSRQPQRLSLV